MNQRFTASFFAGNRQKLRSLVNADTPIILTGNGLLQRTGDTTFPFRQDSNFWYLTGIDEPNITVVIDGNEEYLILPELSQYQEVMEVNFNAKEMSKVSGIKKVYEFKEGWENFAKRIKAANKLATLSASPAYIDHYGFYSNPARANLIKKIKYYSDKIEFIDLRPQLRALRMLKQLPEIDALQDAIDITGLALKTIKNNLNKYNNEYEIEADISQVFRQNGARGHGFAPIVAGGVNATTPHYVTNNEKLKTDTLVVIDIGAEVSNYSADITRTISMTEPTSRQKVIFQAVLEVQQNCLSHIKPGITIHQLEEQTEKYMGDQLLKLGLINSPNHKSIRRFYPHGVSHFLGLDVHDIGDYNQPLKPNMVITVEPGIYIKEEKIGVRIEDDVLVTEGGHKVLSQQIPKKLW